MTFVLLTERLRTRLILTRYVRHLHQFFCQQWKPFPGQKLA